MYRDIISLCKIAKLGAILDANGNAKSYEEDSIDDQDFSLNAGRYVDVVIEDDGLSAEEFKTEMLSQNDALTTLNTEARELEIAISNNLKKLLEGIV